ncbi:MAG: hypothetical protein DHS20C20_11580 [Ardenticatenaceae bacterium]|nr:MAG: hypothetical protein DHS20C20_11580 [Ardenticatenaceae bacterium]
MNQAKSPKDASISQLMTGCSQEQTQGTLTKEYCFELFRRALDLGNEQAWAKIQQQFHPLFKSWVYELATFPVDSFVVEDMLQIALERFWRALSTSDQPLAERFPYFGALLKYMKLCVKSACHEWQQTELRQHRIQQQLVTVSFSTPVTRPLEQLWVHKEHLARCEGLRFWLKTHCQDEAEKLIYQLTFEEELKPRQIVARHPEHFPDVKDVYRIKLRFYRRVQRTFDLGE